MDKAGEHRVLKRPDKSGVRTLQRLDIEPRSLISIFSRHRTYICSLVQLPYIGLQGFLALSTTMSTLSCLFRSDSSGVFRMKTLDFCFANQPNGANARLKRSMLVWLVFKGGFSCCFVTLLSWT